MELTEKTLSSEAIYEGKILDLYKDKISLPNGDESTREYIKHRGAVALVAFDENGDVILVKQYRYPIHDTLLEIPAGKLEKGEEILSAAIRELEEETGYKAESLTYLGKMLPAVGYSNEVIHIYLAENLIKTNPHPDEDEFINTIKMPLCKMEEMIDKNEITDSKTVFALYKYKLHKRNG